MSHLFALSRVFLNQPKKFWSSYLKILKSHPIQTKIATSVAAGFLGDGIAQTLGRPNQGAVEGYDWARTARLCVFNGALGAFGHFYFQLLDKNVMSGASSGIKGVVGKVAVDQLVFAPICTFFFYAFKVHTERPKKQLSAELQEKYLETLKAGWKLWPLAHIINFTFVPNQHRVLYTNVVSVAGTYVLSKAANSKYGKYPANEILFDGVNVKLE